MLLSGKNVARYDIEAKDGPIGKIEDFYLEDDTWVIRYMVVNANRWLPGHKKLISPISVESIDPATQVVALDLTKDQIKNAPPLDSDKPVSRQQEREFYRYYGYAPYWPAADAPAWGPTSLWGGYTNARSLAETNDTIDETKEMIDMEKQDPHLRSLREITGSFTGYDVEATDGKAGHVENALIKNNTWQIEYVIVDTGTFLSSDNVVLSTNVIADVSWVNSEVSVLMTRDEVKKAPNYHPDEGLHKDKDIYEEHFRK